MEKERRGRKGKEEGGGSLLTLTTETHRLDRLKLEPVINDD